jgi:hypothetical protein
MTFWERLWRVQLASLISLLGFASILATLLVLEGVIVSPSETNVVELFVFGVGQTIFYGILPALLLGAPAYIALHSHGVAGWFLLLVIVIFPGIALSFLHRGVGMIGILAGPSILFMTHQLYRRLSGRGG